jgi:NADH dehydrogenase FAD-containing subunit
VLIEATDRVLPSMDERLARRTSQQLRARGVDIRL